MHTITSSVGRVVDFETFEKRLGFKNLVLRPVYAESQVFYCCAECQYAKYLNVYMSLWHNLKSWVNLKDSK